MKRFGLFFSAAVVVCHTAFGAVWRVDKDNTSGTEDGTSWGTAFDTIQEGVDAAFADGGGDVWVAEGTYTGGANFVVTMEEGVYLYGGFAGSESNREERNWETHVTAIDGEQARRCVNGAKNATLDGFIVANGSAVSDGAAGMMDGSAVNCVFVGNIANGECGGMNGDSATNCTFVGNSAALGGGMGGNLAANCIFVGNSAGGHGGGTGGEGLSPAASNCIFVDNHAYFGGGFGNGMSAPPIRNCTLVRNSATEGGAIGNYMSSPTVWNCIL